MRVPELPPQAPGSCCDVRLLSPGCLMPLGVPRGVGAAQGQHGGTGRHPASSWQWPQGQAGPGHRHPLPTAQAGRGLCQLPGRQGLKISRLTGPGRSAWPCSLALERGEAHHSRYGLARESKQVLCGSVSWGPALLLVRYGAPGRHLASFGDLLLQAAGEGSHHAAGQSPPSPPGWVKLFCHGSFLQDTRTPLSRIERDAEAQLAPGWFGIAGAAASTVVSSRAVWDAVRTWRGDPPLLFCCLLALGYLPWFNPGR